MSVELNAMGQLGETMAVHLGHPPIVCCTGGRRCGCYDEDDQWDFVATRRLGCPLHDVYAFDDMAAKLGHDRTSR